MYVEQGRPDQTGESYDSRKNCCSTSNSSAQQYERAVSTVRNVKIPIYRGGDRELFPPSGRE